MGQDDIKIMDANAALAGAAVDMQRAQQAWGEPRATVPQLTPVLTQPAQEAPPCEF